MKAEYRTLKTEAAAEFTERRSRFIGDAAPVSSEEEAIRFLRSVRARHREAKHHVYAYSLRREQIARHSDDGEPQGTAGMPVLDVLVKSGVTDAVIVVTRYFGGILLGTGGLVRAYSHAASLALGQAGTVTMKHCCLLETECSYAGYAAVSALILRSGAVIDRTEYTDSVRFQYHLESKYLTRFRASLSDVTRGSSQAGVLCEKYFAMD